jgi:hypothetical protein
MITNLYTEKCFDSIAASMTFIRSLLGEYGLPFVSFGTSESENITITDKSIAIIARILSDYPLHVFGEVYLRTKKKKIVLKLSNKAAAINRWTLFLSPEYDNKQAFLKTMLPPLKLLTEKENVFFIGADTEEAFTDKHTKDEIADYGNARTVKTGLDDIKQIPGIYWITYLPAKLISGVNKKYKDYVDEEIIFKKGSVLVFAQNATDEKTKEAGVRHFAGLLPPSVLFDKNNKDIPGNELADLVNAQRLEPLHEVAIPYYDFKDDKEVKDITIEKINAVPQRQIIPALSKFKSINDLESFGAAVMKLKKEKWTFSQTATVIYHVGKILGDLAVKELKGEWMIHPHVFKTRVLIKKMSPRTFSPFNLLFQIIYHDMVYEDFLEEILFYK